VDLWCDTGLTTLFCPVGQVKPPPKHPCHTIAASQSAAAWPIANPVGAKASIVRLEGVTQMSPLSAAFHSCLQVVLDNFLDEPTRQGLLDAVTAPGWQGPHPPDTHWARRTADAAQAAPTWGLQGHHLAALAAGDLPAKLEVQSRLCKL
jgi:hypothetical protein